MTRAAHIVTSPDCPQAVASFIRTLTQTQPRGEEVLYNRRNLVQRYRVEGAQIVVKQFATPHPLNRFVYTFLRRSKAERCMTMAARLEALGIATPKVYGFVDAYRGVLFHTGYSIVRYLECPMVSDLDSLPEEERGLLVEQLGDFAAHMHRSGFIHNDFHEGNIFFSREQGRIRFHVIDINRGRFVHASRLRCMKDLILVRLEAPLFDRFLRRYTECMGWDFASCRAEVLRLRRLRIFDKERLRPFVRRLLHMPKYRKLLDE